MDSKVATIGKKHLVIPVRVQFGGRKINGVESRGGSTLRGPLRKGSGSLPLPLGDQ